MQIKQHHKTFRSCKDAGVALITALLLLFLMSSLLVGFCILLISNQQLRVPITTTSRPSMARKRAWSS